MKTQFTRRQCFLFALPLILGVAVWQVRVQPKSTMLRESRISVQSSVGDFSERERDLADTTAIRELARLMRIYPKKRNWAVRYSVYVHWELSYNQSTHRLAHKVVPPIPLQFTKYPRNGEFVTTPQAIQHAAQTGQILGWNGFYPRS